jgi:heme exporter protein A
VLLVAENLVLSRGGRTVIDGLSLRLGDGEALLLTGANGTGKTTLLRALAGFLSPAAGEIRIENENDDRELGELCHFVGHLDGIKPHLRVAENLAFWAAYLDCDVSHFQNDGDRLAGALNKFELTALADIPAGYLSAGQKRRLALSRLAAAHRPVWLLDEPTVSLDTASVALLVNAVNAHCTDGGIVIAATHLPLAFGNVKEFRLGAQENAA